MGDKSPPTINRQDPQIAADTVMISQDWLNQESPHHLIFNTIKYWLGLHSWSFEQSVWIIAGLFRVPEAESDDIIRFGTDPRWQPFSQDQLPKELRRYTLYFENIWTRAGYDLSPQPPHTWIKYAIASEAPVGWIAVGMEEPSLRSWVAPYATLLSAPHLLSVAKAASPSEIQSTVPAKTSEAVYRKPGPKQTARGKQAAERVRELPDDDLIELSGEALAAQLGIGRTQADKYRKGEISRRQSIATDSG